MAIKYNNGNSLSGFVYENQICKRVYWNEHLVFPEPDKAYFWIQATTSGTLTFVNHDAHTTRRKTLQYTTDLVNWPSLVSDSTSISISAGQKVYFKGNSNSISYIGFHFTGNYKVGGNLMSLLDNVATIPDYGFTYLFNMESTLKDATELVLPSSGLVYGCFSSMFHGTGITASPTFPTTASLPNACCTGMFDGCTSLVTAPVLPATSLGAQCYYGMFWGCTSLKTAPALPATNLGTSCYMYMFRDCTKLNTLPSLPAKTLLQNCYNSMFYGCSAIKLKSGSSSSSYPNAYRIPTTGTGTEGSASLNNMFTNTGGTFTGTPSINTTYYTNATIIN